MSQSVLFIIHVEGASETEEKCLRGKELTLALTSNSNSQMLPTMLKIMLAVVAKLLASFCAWLT